VKHYGMAGLALAGLMCLSSCGGADFPCVGATSGGTGGAPEDPAPSSGGTVATGGVRATGGDRNTGGRVGVAGKPSDTGGAQGYPDSGSEAPDANRTPIDPVLACRDMGARFCCGVEEADGQIYSIASCPSCQYGACCTGPGTSPYAGACSCLFPIKDGFGCR
jgi:hypothetical protein